MAAEIICVGTELLLGDIVNTNAQYLALELAKLGIPHYYQTVVGDNVERLKKAIAIALERSSILIFTGGLGPTPDDLTTETIADFFQTPLREDQEILAEIEAKFTSLGREMPPSNSKQALIPVGADFLPNLTGTAPGMIWQPQANVTILTFPGVPSEMKRMWVETAIPYLESQGWGKERIYSRSLKFRGIGESALAEKVAHLFDLTNPTVAPYAGLGEVRLRIATKAPSLEAALQVIEPVATEIKEIAGLDYFGADDDTLPAVVGQLLRRQKQTLSVAESCTGGGLGEIITQIAGSSDYFWGGVISYDNRVKVALLDVNERDLNNFGAVSAIVAQQMALGVQKRLATDWGISITGIAGPGGGSETKPVGLVYIGLASPDGKVTVSEHCFGENRERLTIRQISAYTALDRLRRNLLHWVKHFQ
ncbi:putative competence-damage inducible protein [Microcystis aeruginosa NIES-4325]|uniref:CinA-like protein n=1 Tax=Microcystis aeruginosa NIES-4325 TaxID=2569534 RepID=A0A5J4F8R9_MICAE|nr:competence/damage-inducible protein A [Microcystis aeruginosa]GEA26470.1 putative competence-damage inducible protein [Microcystis aeruginosa NIES-4325]